MRREGEFTVRARAMKTRTGASLWACLHVHVSVCVNVLSREVQWGFARWVHCGCQQDSRCSENCGDRSGWRAQPPPRRRQSAVASSFYAFLRSLFLSLSLCQFKAGEFDVHAWMWHRTRERYTHTHTQTLLVWAELTGLWCARVAMCAPRPRCGAPALRASLVPHPRRNTRSPFLAHISSHTRALMHTVPL